MAAPRHHPASGFPSDLYGKYKHATEFFLGWLLLARTAGSGAASTAGPTRSDAKATRGKLKQSLSITAYQEIVTAIAQEPGSLPPRLLRLWPRALAACQTAITLRTRVALFFASPETSSTVENDDSHAHFVTCLRDWLSLLQRTTKPVITIDAMREELGKIPDFANYYAVLELPDDYFPAEINSSEYTNGRSPSIAKPSAAKIKQSFDDDLNLELSFLFMELEELSEAVHDVFCDVKTEKKTLVEASVVARVANGCAASVIARLQLLYPAIRSAQDIATLIRDRIPAERFQELWTTVQGAWNKTPDTPRPIEYVPGSIVVDMLWVSHALQRFVVRMAHLEQTSTSSFVAPQVDDEFGNRHCYSEDDTPQYVWPSMSDEHPFVQQQMALLCNEVLLMRGSGQKNNPDSFSGWFLDHIDRLITTRTVTLDMVFLCICWFHAVGVLQGDGGLGRTMSLAITHCGAIAHRLHLSLAHGNVEHSLYLCRADVKDALFYTNMAEDVSMLLRANPLLAGGMLLDCQLFFLNVGSSMVYSDSRFLTFAHMYNALCDRQLLEPIPFLEDVLRLHGPSLFVPSRAATVHGSYYCTYKLSCGVTKEHRTGKPDRHQPPPTRYKPHTYLRVKPPVRCGLFDLSHVVCLVKENDFSVLPRELTTASASWKTLLGAVSDMCSNELFESRVLARDMLKLSDDIDDLFILLCEALGRRDEIERVLAHDQSGLARKFLFNSELEITVAFPLLLYADCLEMDGSIQIPDCISKVIKKVKPYAANAANGGKIECYCRSAADVISRFFGQREPAELEATYFIFPPTPDWVSIEFGGALHRAPWQSGTTMDTFHCLIKMLQQSHTLLYGSELMRLKHAIIGDPSVLGVCTIDPDVELCSLLHLAAAGPACDWRLVEWLIQMGALHRQPVHFRNPPTGGGVPASTGLCNTLAMHSAASAGLPGMVRLLLEADHFRDLNTVTFHTRESLAHLAVKHGDKFLFNFLAEMRADLRHRDALGNRVEDLTMDASWKLQIQRAAQEQQRMLAVAPSVMHKLVPKLQQESDAAADRLRDALAIQRDAEQSRCRTRRGDATLRGPRAASPSEVITRLVGSIDSSTATCVAIGSSIAAATPGKTKNPTKKKKRSKKKAAA